MSKNLNLLAPVGKTGYGTTSYNILSTLSQLGWNVSLFPKGPTDRSEAEEKGIINKSRQNADFFDNEAPCLHIWHQNDLAMRVGKGPYIGWPIFELDTFTKQEIHHLKAPDYLIVCSHWAKKILIKNDITTEDKIFVVPLGVSNDIYNRKPLISEGNPTVFLNAGKWEIRKGHDILCDMFNDAFTPEDNVELRLCPYNPFLSAQDQKNWEDMYLDSPMGKAGKIRIFPWQHDQRDLYNIMAGSDCGIFPSRAEGWNLELLEMIAMGKHVITTNYSAHTEFCDERNAYLVDVDELEPAYDGKWFFEQGNWASIGEAECSMFIEFMRSVHEYISFVPLADGVRPQMFVNNSGIETGRIFSWKNSAKKLEEILESLLVR